MPHNFTEADCQEIAEAYLGGMKSPALAKRFDVSGMTICKVLAAAGVERRPIQREVEKQIAETYLSGLTAREVGKQFGVGWGTVKDVYLRLGYTAADRAENAMRRQRDAFVKRFWARVDKSGGDDACWPWMPAQAQGVYGHVFDRVRGGHVSVHRLSWELANGPIPEGLWVLHECDFPPCVNVKHLWLGTPKDNTQDSIAKGRWRR